MRIAVSGTHITGKSTLVAALGDRLPNHAITAEPYELLAARGYTFADPPDVDDFVAQLRQSLVSLRRRSPNRLFDRCPLDCLAYIAASPGADRFDPAAWRAPIARAMASLDLVVLVHADPTHDPAVPAEEAAFRRAVDDAFQNLMDGDGGDLCDGVEILNLAGPWERRAATVLAHLHGRPPGSPRPAKG